MKCYIQIRNGHFVGSNMFDLFCGMNKLGIEAIPFDWDTDPYFEGVDLSQDSMVAGFIDFVYAGMDEIGIVRPKPFDMPNELLSFAGRKVWNSTVAEARKGLVNAFIKPRDSLKLFKGHVLSGSSKDFLNLTHVPDETPIIVSDVVDFASEYRNFVLHNNLIGSKHYKGDFRLAIDYDIVDNAIKSFSNKSPAAYTIDFGITTDKKTLFIECNDAFSFGSYGLDQADYARMTLARWHELAQDS